MAAEIKKALGLTNAVAFDINAACSGFIYAMWIAESLMNGSIPAGEHAEGAGRALVIGSERLYKDNQLGRQGDLYTVWRRSGSGSSRESFRRAGYIVYPC